MDYISQNKINLTCQKHPQNTVEFFAYDQNTLQCNLFCSRCLVFNTNSKLIQIQDTLNSDEEVIPNWPPFKNNELHMQIQDLLIKQTNDSDFKLIESTFKQIRQEIDDFLHTFEKKIMNQLISNNNQSILQYFSKSYMELSQVEIFKSLIWKELSQQKKFDSISEEFQSFLKKIHQNGEIEEQLKKLIIEYEKQQNKNSPLDEINKLKQSLNLLYNQYQILPSLISGHEKKQQEYQILQKEYNQLKNQVSQSKLTVSSKQDEIKKTSSQSKSIILSQQEQTKTIQAKPKEQAINISQFYDSLLKFQVKFEQHKHSLQFTDKKMRIDFNRKCDLCKVKINNYVWNCSNCEFDICLNCSSEINYFSQQYQSLLKYEFKFQCHNHYLIFTDKIIRPKDVNRKCNNCLGPIKNYVWHCFIDDYDLCLNCSSGITNVSKP